MSHASNDRKKVKALPLALALGLGMTSLAQAQEETISFGEDYLIGGSVTSGTSHIGHGDRHWTFSPMWAFRLGKLKVSRSRANTLLTAGRGSSETGVTADLVDKDDYTVSASLRIDNGRSFDAGHELHGLPDVATTLRVRGAYRYNLSSRWRVGLYADQDLLDRQGGMRMSTYTTYKLPVGEQSFIGGSMTLAWADKTYLRSHYGVGNAGAQATGLAVFRPGSGWYDTRLSLDYTHIFNDHWVGFVALNTSHLMGPVRESPLVGKRNTNAVTVGIAYRNNRRK
ncbi:MipA/OmpV family protein [Hydrogenophaga sp. 5NK40-0174]|uniref:MipA/OmpV family protein n=1 Tax=Hydrogenophaga sp. 5NK40-0174 TaxID=3127649 RepID=UPI0031074E58